jgi:hypothetical protein
MVSDPKTNEWNLLKDQFDALAHSKGVRQDNLEQVLDDGIRRRFGELIAWAAGHEAKGYHGPGHPAHIAHPRGGSRVARIRLSFS